jgi:hypothetical protein
VRWEEAGKSTLTRIIHDRKIFGMGRGERLAFAPGFAIGVECGGAPYPHGAWGHSGWEGAGYRAANCANRPRTRNGLGPEIILDLEPALRINLQHYRKTTKQTREWAKVCNLAQGSSVAKGFCRNLARLSFPGARQAAEVFALQFNRLT